jgi:hypothetical protein
MITTPTITLTAGETTYTFTGSQIISASLIEEVNPVSIEIPYNVIEFEIINSDIDFSMFSGSLLSERLPVMVYETKEETEIFIGKFYLDTWKNESEYKVSFRAIDILGVLASTDYDGGFWETPTALEEVIYDILAPQGISYTIDDSIKDVEISGYNPSGDYRSAIQQVCFAAQCVVSTARSDRINFYPVSLPVGAYTKKIHDSEKLQSEPIDLLSLVTKIELISHDYTKTSTDIQTIFSQYLEIGSHKIVFDQPYYDLVIDGPGYTPYVLGDESGNYIVTENGDYIEIGGQYTLDSNALYMELQEAGTVTVTGYAYTDNKKSFIFNETITSSSSNKKTCKFSSATMVSSSYAETVLDNLIDYYRLRYEQVLTLLPSEVEVRDILLSGTFFDTKILGSINKMEIDLTRGFLLKSTLLGIEPVYVEPEEHPTRLPRTGIAICGADLTYNNRWRNYL